jgi:polyisoprenoid-binding protein YceI
VKSIRKQPFTSWSHILLAAFFALMQLVAGASALYAQQITIKLAPEQTRVEFTLGATMHTVRGSFQLKSGLMTFDTTTGKADGRIVVNATSGQSGDSSRDARMHKDVLETGKYPEIVFIPGQVEGGIPPQGNLHAVVHGILRLHGADQQLDMTVQGKRTANGITAATDFAIPYVKWGLKNPSNFLLHVSEEVQIHVETTASATAVANPALPH